VKRRNQKLSSRRQQTQINTDIFLKSQIPNLNPAPYPYLQSQRDCVTQPRVARNELPWVKVPDNSQPQRGCGMVLFPLSSATTLSGLSSMSRAFSQGSSSLATLGFVTESLLDS